MATRAMVKKAVIFAAGMCAGIFAHAFHPPDLNDIEASIIVGISVMVIWLITYFATGGKFED